MENSTYIQRLTKPTGDWNPFNFGYGGIHKRAFPEEFMDVVSTVWSFDYMGRAEFEFGAVPEALDKISTFVLKGDVVNKTITIPYKYTDVYGDHAVLTGEGEVYVICHKDHLEEVIKRIKRYAKNQRPMDCKTSERVMLSGSMAKEEVERRYMGWLELPNGYMFFVDKKMYQRACDLFGIE